MASTRTSPSGRSNRPLRALFSAAKIRRRVRYLARRISREHRGEPPILVGVLRAGFMFVADLARLLPGAEVEFVAASSYDDGRRSRGRVTLGPGPSARVKGRAVVIVDCVLDTGRTLRAVEHRLRRLGASPIRTCVLVRKPSRARATYVGFSGPRGFLVGYGLDLAHKYRTLSYIAVIS